MGIKDDFEEVEGIFLAKTDLAILLDLSDGKEWFPISQLGGNFDPDVPEPGDEITILVPAWIMKKRGL